MRTLYVYAVLTAIVANAASYLLGLAYTPAIEGNIMMFGLGMAWTTSMPWWWKSLRRLTR